MLEKEEIRKRSSTKSYLRTLGRDVLRDYELYLFLLPALVYIIIFAYGPIYGLQIAFKKYNGALGIWGSPWVGLKHFRGFFDSYYFWPVIRNTVFVSLYSLAAGFPLPIILALGLNDMGNMRYRKFIQTVTYAPHFISTVVLVGMLGVVFSRSFGIVNFARAALGLSSRDYLGDPNVFRHMYVWSGVWQGTGWGSIIYLAALSAISPELIEAALIDGANRFERIWYINIPHIAPTMIILLILNAGSIMSVGFEKVFLMQNNLNMATADVISTYIYRRGLIDSDFSFSSAVGLFNNVINFIMLIAVNSISRRVSSISLF